MNESDLLRKNRRAEDAAFVLDGEAASTSTPYFWSWYRLVFPKQSSDQDDDQQPVSTED